jgi:hypothetical protein
MRWPASWGGQTAARRLTDSQRASRLWAPVHRLLGVVQKMHFDRDLEEGDEIAETSRILRPPQQTVRIARERYFSRPA